MHNTSVIRSLTFALFALSAPALACENAAFAALKLLAGDWEVARDGAPYGELHLRATAGGCALVEEWTAADGTAAAAMHWPERIVNDAGEPTDALRQVYIDSTGWLIHAEGRLVRDNILVYEGETVRDEKTLRLRATLHGLGSDAIVHINDVSEDGGATWHRASVFNYRRVKTNPGR